MRPPELGVVGWDSRRQAGRGWSAQGDSLGLGFQGTRGVSGEVGRGLGLKGRAVGGPGGLPEAWQRAIGRLGRRGAGQLGDPTRRGEGENLKG